jgi:hypothetical protein
LKSRGFAYREVVWLIHGLLCLIQAFDYATGDIEILKKSAGYVFSSVHEPEMSCSVAKSWKNFPANPAEKFGR